MINMYIFYRSFQIFTRFNIYVIHIKFIFKKKEIRSQESNERCHWNITSRVGLRRSFSQTHVIDNCEKVSGRFNIADISSLSRSSYHESSYRLLLFFTKMQTCTRVADVYYTDIGYLNRKLCYGYRFAININGSHFACLSVASGPFWVIEKCEKMWKMWKKRLKNVASSTKEKNKRTPTRRFQECLFSILKTYTRTRVCLMKNESLKNNRDFVIKKNIIYMI